MRFFHGSKQKGPYFEGWYCKHQTPDGRSLALIPAFHISSEGRRSASLQVLTERGSWWLEYPEDQFRASRDQFQVQAGPLRLHAQGLSVDISRDGLSLRGALRYGPFTALRSDIMGPFRLFANMQCAHGVYSMGHALEGRLVLNGDTLDFTGGTGYAETDRGRSFPDAYLWTQCVWPGAEGGSLMLAIASVPLPVGGFTGCICAILYRGREYRLATYRGARIETWSPSGAAVRQGACRLEAELLEARGQPLRAPAEGRMDRTIHESLCATVRYRFWQGGTLLFSRTDPLASFEYARATDGSHQESER